MEKNVLEWDGLCGEVMVKSWHLEDNSKYQCMEKPLWNSPNRICWGFDNNKVNNGRKWCQLFKSGYILRTTPQTARGFWLARRYEEKRQQLYLLWLAISTTNCCYYNMTCLCTITIHHCCLHFLKSIPEWVTASEIH
jgi:hypothetical protein